jgi:hypothetical protein
VAVLRVRQPPGYPAERRYIAEVLLEGFLGLGCTFVTEARGDVEIELEGDASGARLVLADVLFQTPESEWLAPSSLPSEPLARAAAAQMHADVALVDSSLPVVFGRRLPNGSFFEDSAGRNALGIDIFGSAFFMLTRYEELVSAARDAHGRFPAAFSLAHRERFLDRPVVNEYLELLWSSLRRLWPRLERRPVRFRERLTHDVDWAFYARLPALSQMRAAAGDVLVRRDPALGVARLRSYVRTRGGNLDADVCNTFDFLMDQSERRALRSAFYFIAGGAGTGGDEMSPYSLEDAWIRRLLRRIHERGHEIGLHGSYESFRSTTQLRAEFATLQRVCLEEGIEQDSWGGRQHYLRFENPATWQAWEECGLAYDSTLAYPEAPGFRCGVCFEYPVFNLRTRRRLGLTERPLIVMEASLLDRQYLRLPADTALARIQELRHRCRRFGGEFNLLWHNSWLLTRHQKRLYELAVA